MLLFMHMLLLLLGQFYRECQGGTSTKEIFIIWFVYLSPDVTLVKEDKKHLYVLQMLTLLLVWHGFDDAIHEEDGDHVLTYWKLLEVSGSGIQSNEALELF